MIPIPMVATRILSFGLTDGLNGIVRVFVSFDASDLNGPAASNREVPPSCLMNFLRDDLTFIIWFLKIVYNVIYPLKLKCSHKIKKIRINQLFYEEILIFREIYR
jgi:hypothetical protein